MLKHTNGNGTGTAVSFQKLMSFQQLTLSVHKKDHAIFDGEMDFKEFRMLKREIKKEDLTKSRKLLSNPPFVPLTGLLCCEMSFIVMGKGDTMISFLYFLYLRVR